MFSWDITFAVTWASCDWCRILSGSLVCLDLFEVPSLYVFAWIRSAGGSRVGVARLDLVGIPLSGSGRGNVGLPLRTAALPNLFAAGGDTPQDQLELEPSALLENLTPSILPSLEPPPLSWRSLDRMIPEGDLADVLLGGGFTLRPWELVVSEFERRVFVMQSVELCGEERWERFFGHVTILKGLPRPYFRTTASFTDFARGEWAEFEAELRSVFGRDRSFSMYIRRRRGPDAGAMHLDVGSWFEPVIRRSAHAQIALRRPEKANCLIRSCRWCAFGLGELLRVETLPRETFHLSIDSAWTPTVIPVVPVTAWGTHAPSTGHEAALDALIASGAV